MIHGVSIKTIQREMCRSRKGLNRVNRDPDYYIDHTVVNKLEIEELVCITNCHPVTNSRGFQGLLA